MSVIYLLSSLPLLRFDTPPALAPEAFLSACRDQLAAADAAAAEALLTGTACDHPFVAAWRDRDTILRNAVARQRARLAGAEASRWLRSAQGCDTRIESLVEDAFDEPDPLRREKAERKQEESLSLVKGRSENAETRNYQKKKNPGRPDL